MQGQTFTRDFVNGTRLDDSFRRSRFLSHLFCSYFQCPFCLFFVGITNASAHTGESSSLPFSSSYLGLYCVVVRFWNFHFGRCRTFVLPRTYRRWRTGQYRFERYPPAFCNIEPACRFSLAYGSPVNGLTLPWMGLSSCGLSELKTRLLHVSFRKIVKLV